MQSLAAPAEADMKRGRQIHPLGMDWRPDRRSTLLPRRKRGVLLQPSLKRSPLAVRRPAAPESQSSTSSNARKRLRS